MPKPNRKSQTARILSTELVYEGPVFGVRRETVVEPTGITTTREVITHPGSVVVLPVLPDGKIVMIRQYRHATKQFLWELVAGRIDHGEAPRAAAERLSTKVDREHRLPFKEEALEDAGLIIEWALTTRDEPPG